MGLVLSRFSTKIHVILTVATTIIIIMLRRGQSQARKPIGSILQPRNLLTFWVHSIALPFNLGRPLTTQSSSSKTIALMWQLRLLKMM